MQCNEDNGNITFRFKDENDKKECSLADGKLTAGSETGIVTVIVLSAGDNNHEPAYKEITVRISDRKLVQLTVTQENNTYGQAASELNISGLPDDCQQDRLQMVYGGEQNDGPIHMGGDPPAAAGDYAVLVYYETADTMYYGGCRFIVNKAVPVISTDPSASDITYGQALKDSNLTGQAYRNNTPAGDQAIPHTISKESGVVPGNFTWAQPDIKPTVADSENTKYNVVFIPDDRNNYETAACTADLVIRKGNLLSLFEKKMGMS